MYLARSNALILDEMERIEVKKFKELFKKAIRIAEALQEDPPKGAVEASFTMNEISYKAFPTLRREYERETEGGALFSFHPKEILFEWKDRQGTERSQRITLYERDNYLEGKKPSYLFICSFSGNNCRKLYASYEGYLLCRKAMKNAHYRSEYLYPSRRPLLKSLSYLLKIETSSPYKAYGKPYFKGKLTPYGKKLKKYEAKCLYYLEEMKKLQGR